MNDTPVLKRHIAKRIVRRLIFLGGVLFAVLLTLILVGAFASRWKAPIESWHHKVPLSQFVAKDVVEGYTFKDYQTQEQMVFEELKDYMLDPQKLNGFSPLLRFVSGGPQDPARQKINWNRSVELIPENPKGGVLLLHGLSDSPYSMRSLAELFHAEGYHVLAMRMPGHGTVPAGLLHVTWEDWAAAVKVGALHVQSKVGDDLLFFIGGYSNGGALAVQHTLNAIESDTRIPDRLFLFSPAIAITALGRAARWDALYGFIPYFEKSRWLDIETEYDPYKYNSFTKNAGSQSWRLAGRIYSQLSDLENNGHLGQVPPILTFQSVVDDTVLAAGLLTVFYDRLEANGSEVVFFDVNHASELEGFVSLDFSQHLDYRIHQIDQNFTITRVTNRDADSHELIAQTHTPGVEDLHEASLGMEWPADVFSLSHVAIPFPPDDSLYGRSPADPDAFGVHIGTLTPRGERKVLSIPANLLIRIRYNPFHKYMTDRITQTIRAANK